MTLTKEVEDAILYATRAQLAEIIRLAKIRRTKLELETAQYFARDDEVEFEDNKGKTLRGKVVRVNTKTITVAVDEFLEWRVPPTMLRHVS